PPAARRSPWWRRAGKSNRPDGYHDAANGRIPDHGLDPAEPVVQPAADHRAHRESDEGRPREMPGGRRLRLSGETRQYRTIASRHSHVASPLTGTFNDGPRTGKHSTGRRSAGEAARL